MSLSVSPVKFFSFSGKSNAATAQKENRQPEYDKNPVSGKGETMNLIKANVTRKSELIDTVIEDITNIRWGFQKAIEIQNGTVTLEEAMQEQQAMEGAEHPLLRKDDNNAG